MTAKNAQALHEVAQVEKPKPAGLELTLAECLAAEQGLANLAKLPSNYKIAYHIAKLLKLVREETRHFNEQTESLIKELGGKRPATPMELANGGPAEVTEVLPDNREKYYARQKELGEVVVRIAWQPLTMAELEGLGNVRGQDVHQLGPLLAEETP